jgi:hypothetical protein
MFQISFIETYELKNRKDMALASQLERLIAFTHHLNLCIPNPSKSILRLGGVFQRDSFGILEEKKGGNDFEI